MPLFRLPFIASILLLSTFAEALFASTQTSAFSGDGALTASIAVARRIVSDVDYRNLELFESGQVLLRQGRLEMGAECAAALSDYRRIRLAGLLAEAAAGLANEDLFQRCRKMVEAGAPADRPYQAQILMAWQTILAAKPERAPLEDVLAKMARQQEKVLVLARLSNLREVRGQEAENVRDQVLTVVTNPKFAPELLEYARARLDLARVLARSDPGKAEDYVLDALEVAAASHTEALPEKVLALEIMNQVRQQKKDAPSERLMAVAREVASELRGTEVGMEWRAASAAVALPILQALQLQSEIEAIGQHFLALSETARAMDSPKFLAVNAMARQIVGPEPEDLAQWSMVFDRIMENPNERLRLMNASFILRMMGSAGLGLDDATIAQWLEKLPHRA